MESAPGASQASEKQMTTKELFQAGERSDRELLARSIEALAVAPPVDLIVVLLEKHLRDLAATKRELLAIH